MRLTATGSLVLAIFGTALVSSAEAQTPRTISYQGTLTQPDGSPVPSGEYTLTFKLYDQSSGGSALFTETQNVTVTSGYFAVEIGSTGPSGLPPSLTFDRPYFLGLTIGSGSEFSQRTRFTTSPYAFKAVTADSARFIAAGTVGAENLRDGSITPAKIDASGTTAGQLLVSNGTGVTWRNASDVAVTSLNNQKGPLTIVGGPNTTVSTSGSQISISSASGIASVGATDNVIVVQNSTGPNVSLGIAANSIGAFQLAPGGVGTTAIADGAVTDAKVANGISYSKLSGVPTSLPPSGPASGDLTGTYPGPVIAANAVNSAKIADGSVVTADLGDSSVTSAKIAMGAVTSVSLADSSITNADVANNAAIAYGKLNLVNSIVTNDLTDGSVTSVKIADGSIVNADVSSTAALAYSKLALANSITSNDLVDGTIVTVDIADGAVNSAKLLDGTIATADLADGSVNSAKLLDGTIVNADVSPTAAVAYSKLNLANSIVSNDLVDGTIATGDLADGSVTTAKHADASVTTAKLADGSVTSAKILDGEITNADVNASAAIAYTKLNLVNSIVAGDLTTGSVTGPKIAADAVTTSKIADGSVQSSDLKDGDVQTIDIADGAVTSLKILDATIATADLADGSVNSAKLLDGTIVNADVSPTAAIAYSKLALTNSIVTADLTDGSVTDAKVANGISYSKLSGAPTSLPPSGAAGGDLTGTYPNPTVAANAITSAKIADGTIVDADVSPTAAIAYSKLNLINSIQNQDIVANAITTSKVANGTVTTSKLADSAVSGLKLLTYAVNTAHIADGAVTDAKVANGISYSKLSGAPTSLPPSGAAGGDLTGTYPNPVVAANAITSAKIADGTITNADVSAAAAVAYSKLNLTGSIQGSDIAAGTMTTTNSHRALGNNDNVARELRMLEPSGSGVNYTAFKAQAQAGDITYTLPNTAPTSAGQVLQAQAVSGNNATLSWTSIGGGAILFARTGVVANAGNTSYTIQSADDIVGIDMSAGTNFTVNLQPATTVGEILIIKIEKYNNALLPVLTIQPNGTDKIEGANNLAFGNAGGIRRLYSDGAGNWYTW